jgi:hypothetical protein
VRRVCAALVLLLAGACGVPTDPDPRPIPDDRVPFDLLSPDAGSPSPPSTSTP